ncbi:ATP-dependent RNA helicase DDX42 [Entomortierella parvispora]|uniref:RNA helicase n=1 Tax=Entomortierella parvispora TaxID=205924 RepID=A0A9P3HFK7_9FUNG|nr:ATP-dependent RNA helicase DDX42 [Entomortierella parvispora]
MSKRPISFGSAGLGLKSSPFSRLSRPAAAKSSLGFDNDEDEQDEEHNKGLHRRKQLKLDDELEDRDERTADKGLEEPKVSHTPFFLKKPLGRTDVEDEEDAFSRLKSNKEPSKEINDNATVKTDEEEADPLDAFMAEIDTQVQKEADAPPEEKIRRDDIEDEDEIESYMKHMKRKGITIGQGGPVKDRPEDADSDEEVYATARAIDNAAEAMLDNDDYDAQSGVKKEITPLPRIDHSKQDYIDIEKCFYEEHEDIAKLTEEQVRKIRSELDMRISGVAVAKPCISFAHFGFEEALMETIRRAGYSEPSGIQQQAIPVALSGRDIIGIAKTGSGKTAAFLLPMIVHIMDQEELEKGDGPIGVVLAPTRELADQIYSEAKRFAKAYGLRVAVIYGGASKQDQFKALRSGVEIVVATPGRLIDMIKIKATNFRRTSYLVLDEADRVFDLGFEPQVRSICDNIRPDRQTLLFSATFQKRVERLAREVMSDPVRISIGNVGQINSDVTQVIDVLKDDSLKWNWLLSRLSEFEALGSVMIFVSRKSGVVELTENLQNAGVNCQCLHGDMQQQERDKAVHDYKTKVFPTLVATDVAARGLDIKSIRTVVNYDVARDIDSHVHRVGRTGRAGEKGTAYTLITEKDDRFAGELVRNLEEFGQPVSPDVMKIAMQNPRFRKARQFMGGNRGGRGGRGRGRAPDRGRGSNRGRGGFGGGRDGFNGGGKFNHGDNVHSSASNATPLGAGYRNDGRRYEAEDVRDGQQPYHQSKEPTRGSSSGYRVSGFQKATRPETGAQEGSLRPLPLAMASSQSARSPDSQYLSPSMHQSQPPGNQPRPLRPPPEYGAPLSYPRPPPPPPPPLSHGFHPSAQHHFRPPPPPSPVGLPSQGQVPSRPPPHQLGDHQRPSFYPPPPHAYRPPQPQMAPHHQRPPYPPPPHGYQGDSHRPPLEHPPRDSERRRRWD